MAESISLLAVADTHIGGDLSMKRKGSSLQQKIVGKWDEMVHQNGKVDYFVVNGDLCEGVNYKEKGKGCYTTDVMKQASDAMSFFDMVRCRRMLVTQGSGYHTGFNPSLDAYVAEKMGAVFDNEIMLKAGGIQFWIKHEVPLSGVPENRKNTLRGAFRDADNYEEEYGHTDVVLRAHAHYYINFYEAVEDGRSSRVHHGIVLPAWKGKDGYMQRAAGGYTPDLGWVRFDITGKEYKVEAHIFNLKGKDLLTVTT